MAASRIPSSLDAIFWGRSTEPYLNDPTVSIKESIGRNVSGSSKVFMEVNAVLWNVAPPLLLLFGTFGNVMTVVVMRGMRSSQSTACLSMYFTALALSDQSVLTSCVLFFWVDMGFSWPPSFFRFDLLCSIPKSVWLTSATMSAWFLVAMTYQRVASVVVPHRVQIVCSVRRGKFVIATIVVLSCALNLQYLFSWAYWPEHDQCRSRKKYMPFTDLFEWLDLVCGSLIPFLLLASGNSVLIWQVLASTQLSQKLRGNVQQQAPSGTDKVHSMTKTLILTSAMFLVLTLPICLIDVCLKYYIYSEEFGAMISVVTSVADIMWLSSTASNFYLYILSGSKFRQETKRCLPCHGTEHTKATV